MKLSRLTASWTAGRIVTLLTPLLFVPLAGFIALQGAKLGIVLPEDETVKFLGELAIFAIGALVAYAKSSTWLKNYASWEVAEAEALSNVPAKVEVVEQLEVTDEEVEEAYAKLQ